MINDGDVESAAKLFAVHAYGVAITVVADDDFSIWPVLINGALKGLCEKIRLVGWDKNAD
ncbi:hypothetical protein D3C71_1777900 [compost metagenome]